MAADLPSILCSIVSHGQANLLANLLRDLERLNLGDNVRFIVTENAADTAGIAFALQSQFALRGQLKTIKNDRQLGFGANHNQAFLRSESLFPNFVLNTYVVLNPDLRISQDVINLLSARLVLDSKIGILAPEVFTSDGNLEDSARYTPTVNRIIRKLLFGDLGMFPRIADGPYEPDIISGMCLAFNADCFRELGGFDEAYFMYYEDADICLRAKSKGYRVQMEPSLSVVHDAQRLSHRDSRMTLIHLKSMARFFLKSR